jgi:Carboxypeptidase regulatory-like domain
MSIGRTEPKSSGFPLAAISVDEAAKKLPALATLAMLLLLPAKGASGQSAAFATIAGRVLDAKGASVSRASVTATNVETALVRKTDTTEDGLYQFDHLTPGLYDISVEAGSFAQARQRI